MQEGLAVEPLLLGCGLKACDLKRLGISPSKLIMGVQINHLVGCGLKAHDLKRLGIRPSKLIMDVQINQFTERIWRSVF